MEVKVTEEIRFDVRPVVVFEIPAIGLNIV